MYPFANIHWWSSFIKNPFFIDTDEILYSKNQSYNKYTIINSNGLQHLSIPLESGRNQRIPFSKIKISYHEDWRRNHWRSLTSAYNNSAFFEFYSHLFEKFYERSFQYLYEFNRDAFLLVCNILKLKTEGIRTLSLSDLSDTEGTEYLYNNKKIAFSNPPYYQVFSERTGFLENVSVLDLIFNTGTESPVYLKQLYTSGNK